jgi:hypothetical protein
MTSPRTTPMATTRRSPLNLALSLLVASGLIVDAVVHLRLAPGYQLADPTGTGQGNLFRIEAVVALVAAAYVLLRGSRLAFLTAALVGLSAFVAVVITRYLEIPAIGPIPSMYEPIWFLQKTLSAVAEAAVAVLGLIGAIVVTRRQLQSGRRPTNKNRAPSKR